MLAPVLLAASVALGIDVFMIEDVSLTTGALSIVSGDDEGAELELHVSTLGVGSLVDLGVRQYVGTAKVRPWFSLRGGAALVGLVPVVPTLSAGIGLQMGGAGAGAFELEVGATVAPTMEGLARAMRICLGVRF
jgi:hypothetical protein